jgi:hypothetical protein
VETDEIGAPESAFVPAADPKRREEPRVGPAPQRGGADLKQRSRLPDAEQFRFAHLWGTRRQTGLAASTTLTHEQKIPFLIAMINFYDGLNVILG